MTISVGMNSINILILFERSTLPQMKFCMGHSVLVKLFKKILLQKYDIHTHYVVNFYFKHFFFPFPWQGQVHDDQQEHDDQEEVYSYTCTQCSKTTPLARITKELDRIGVETSSKLKEIHQLETECSKLS